MKLRASIQENDKTTQRQEREEKKAEKHTAYTITQWRERERVMVIELLQRKKTHNWQKKEKSVSISYNMIAVFSSFVRRRIFMS